MNFYKLISYVVLIYTVVGVSVFFMQSSLLYYPNLPTRDHIATPELLGLEYQDVEFISEDNVKLHGWFIPADDTTTTLLFFHGNAGNISHRLESIKIFHSLGLNVFIIDYRGYGKSEGEITEQGSYMDAKAAWIYLINNKGYDGKDVIIFGRSLGASIAAWLASQVTASGLILESSFSSVISMGQHLYPFLPVRWLTRFNYDTAAYLKNVTYPVLVAHSKQDDIIPYEQGQLVFEAALEPKIFLSMKGDHNNGYRVSGSAYINGLRNFIDEKLEKK